MSEDGDLLGSEKREQKTQFHGGFSYLERIDHILRALDASSFPEDTIEKTIKGLTLEQYRQRLALLKILFLELSPKLEKEERRKHHETYRNLEKLFEEVVKQLSYGQTQFVNFTHDFDIWELELRNIVNDKGLLMPSKKGALDASEL